MVGHTIMFYCLTGDQLKKETKITNSITRARPNLLQSAISSRITANA